MLGTNQWTFYPSGSYGYGPIGPKLSERYSTVGDPQQLVSKTPSKALGPKSISAPFTRTGNTADSIRDAVYAKVPGPKSYLLPNLAPSANFTLPTDKDRVMKPIQLGENLEDETKDLSGIDLLSAMMRYLKKTDVFKLDAKEFQAVLDTGDRLRLSPDPAVARLKQNYDNTLSDDDFFKLELWLLSTPAADPNIKRGYVKIEPGGVQVPVTKLLSLPTWTMRTISRIAETDVLIPDIKAVIDSGEVVDNEERKQYGIQDPNYASAPNAALGRDGDNGAAPDPTTLPSGRRNPSETVRQLMLRQNEMESELLPPSLERANVIRTLEEPRYQPAPSFLKLEPRSVNDLLSRQAEINRNLELTPVQPSLEGTPRFTPTEVQTITKDWPAALYETTDNLERDTQDLWDLAPPALKSLFVRKRTQQYKPTKIFMEMRRIFDEYRSSVFRSMAFKPPAQPSRPSFRYNPDTNTVDQVEEQSFGF